MNVTHTKRTVLIYRYTVHLTWFLFADCREMYSVVSEAADWAILSVSFHLLHIQEEFRELFRFFNKNKFKKHNGTKHLSAYKCTNVQTSLSMFQHNQNPHFLMSIKKFCPSVFCHSHSRTINSLTNCDTVHKLDLEFQFISHAVE